MSDSNEFQKSNIRSTMWKRFVVISKCQSITTVNQV